MIFFLTNQILKIFIVHTYTFIRFIYSLYKTQTNELFLNSTQVKYLYFKWYFKADPLKYMNDFKCTNHSINCKKYNRYCSLCYTKTGQIKEENKSQKKKQKIYIFFENHVFFKKSFLVFI